MRLKKRTAAVFFPWFAILLMGALSLSFAAESASIVFQGEWTSPNAESARHIQVVGDYAYLTTGNATFKILDIRDPANPALAGQVPMHGVRLAVAGDYAYVSAGSQQRSLMVVSIANKQQPAIVGSFAATTDIMDALVVDGDRLYVGTVTQLSVYSLANPQAPALLGSFAVEAQRVAVLNGLAYVARKDSDIRVVDVSNPQSMSVVGFVDSRVMDMKIDGGKLYIAGNPANAGLWIFDLSNPVMPARLFVSSSLSTLARPVSFETLAVSGDAAVLCGQVGGAYFFDVSVPAAATVTATNTTASVSLAGSDGFIFAASGQNGVRVFDVNEPVDPELVAVFQTDSYFTGWAFIGNYAYVADRFGPVHILDVSNPAPPIKVGEFLPKEWFGRGILAYAGRLYTQSEDGFAIYDLTNPLSPSLVKAFVAGAPRMPGTVSGNFAFIPRATISQNLIDVVNVAPTPPQLVSTFVSDRVVPYLESYGNYLYAWGSAPLSVIDAADPQNLRFVQTLGGLPRDVRVIGPNLFAADTSRLRVFDLANPIQPPLLDEFPSGSTTFLALSSGRIFMAGQDYKSRASLLLLDARALHDLQFIERVNLTLERSIFEAEARDNFGFTLTPFAFEAWELTLGPEPQRPSLAVARTDEGHVVFSWPAEFSEFKLHMAPGIGGQWQLVTENPATQGGFFNYTNRFPLADIQIYRLQKP